MDTKTTKEKFLRRHRVYIFGITSGFGLGLLSIEAFQQQKNPILYIGGFALISWGGWLYRHRDN